MESHKDNDDRTLLTWTLARTVAQTWRYRLMCVWKISC